MSTDPIKVGARVVGHRKIKPEELLKLDGETFIDQSFNDRVLLGFWSHGCRFERCSFDRMVVEDMHFGSGLTTSRYIKCSFDGAKLRAPTPGTARFEQCSFSNIDLKEMISFGVELIDCVFSGQAQNCVFNGTPHARRRERWGRDHNEFRGNDFSALEMRGCDFRTGIDLRAQRLPTGPSYIYVSDAREAVSRALVEVADWDDELRPPALRYLDQLERAIDAGQEQLFLEATSRYEWLTAVQKVLAATR